MEKMLKQSLEAVKECVAYAELNNLTDTQEFINWEDELNALSVKEHVRI